MTRLDWNMALLCIDSHLAPRLENVAPAFGTEIKLRLLTQPKPKRATTPGRWRAVPGNGRDHATASKVSSSHLEWLYGRGFWGYFDSLRAAD